MTGILCFKTGSTYYQGMWEMILYIKKRDGQKALFNPEKIMNALKKAFVASNQSATEGILQEMTEYVIEELQSKYREESVPSVEHTQDIVELMLMRKGHMEVAKSYILYRAEHKQLRETKLLRDIQTNNLNVLTNDGVEVPFRASIIESKLKRLANNLSKIDLETVLNDVCKNVYQKMPVTEIDDLVTSVVKQRIENHYNYGYLASRIVLDGLYENVLNSQFGGESLPHQYSSKFSNYIQKGIDLELLNPELAEKFDLKIIGAAIKPERDQLFLYLGMQTIFDRYLLREREGVQSVFELPQWMWMRVSMGLALLEDNPTERAIEFYTELSQMNVVSSTPTLFNSGTAHSQMSSCYLNTVTDSMEGIFKNFADNAQLSKWAGGIGTNWTAVRSKGAGIRGTNGKSQGIVPFLKIFNDVALAVNQGGKRKGAMAAYLEVWHLDLEEFCELKKNTGDERRRAHDIHTAVFINDLFMKRVQERGKWTLFSPDAVPELQDAYGRKFNELYEHYETLDLPGSKTLDAIDVWKKILTMLFETGHPWITFKDPINVRSPQDHVGVVRNSNLCTEITLNTSEDETAVCNLASINMSKMIKDKKLDEDKIKKTVSVAMRMLDNVVDNNFYPIPEAKNSNMKHRPVGLGMMGYQDALYQMEIDFDSEENLEFSDQSMELISHSAILASAHLAEERGAYESFPGSKWDRGILPLDSLLLLEQERGSEIKVPKGSFYDWTPVREAIQKFGMRNSNCMAIAPTATISNIAGTVPCVEPTYKNIYMKENLSGNFLVVNKFLVDALENEGIWSEETLTKIKVHNGSVINVDDIPVAIRRRFKETFEIEPSWILKSAARRGKWIDQSASTNIFIKTTSGRILSETYTMAWEMGLKTTYYLRTLAATQITKTVGMEESAKAPSPTASAPAEAMATTHAATETPMAVSQEASAFSSVSKGPEMAPQPAGFKACSIDDPDCEACQ